jgi:hypothetical protein
MLRIVLGCIIAAIVYGIVHDQITARICVEYFTVGHPPIFNTQSPTLLAFGWGVIATWWMGAILGSLLALAARAGRWPKVAPVAMVRPILWLLCVMAVGALAGGAVGLWMARKGKVFLPEPLASQVPAAKHIPFLVDFFAHGASYFFAILGGSVLIFIVLTNRRRAAGIRAASLASRPAQP